MPELPEVETVIRSLKPLIINKTIQKLQAPWPRSLTAFSEKEFNKKIQGCKITSIQRRAKWILLLLKNGCYIGIHLRMTGKLYPVNSTELKQLNLFHISAIFTLSKSQFLIFEDQRRFGRIIFIKDTDYSIFSKKFGPEPLEDAFTKKWLKVALGNSKRKIKPLLLDQKFLAGLGNIYVDEALWLAQIHPETKANMVPSDKTYKLRNAIRQVLQKSIESNGATFMNFKFLGGKEGGYTDHLLVFRRTGQPCLKCKTSIEKIKVVQRSTHFCPKCQQA